MRYNESYENKVKETINQVLSNVQKCWDKAKNITKIPDDFERAGEISNIKEGITNIKFGDIYLEITSITNGYANADIKACSILPNM